MKKKICHWLNSKESGVLVFRYGCVTACCTRDIILLSGDIDYTQLSYDDIQNKRIELFETINKGTSRCDGCGFLHETDEQNIDIGQLGYIVYHPHKTCNLRCIYCPYVKSGEVQSKFDKNKHNPYNVITHFHDIRLVKKNFTFEFGGGEPLLLENIPETINFMTEHYPDSTALFVSNFTLTDKVEKLIPILAKRKIKSVIKTSIDCGTASTYKKIRGKDLYNNLRNNLINAAKNNAFDEIYLKYIYLDNLSNVTKADTKGFIELVKEVKKNNPNKTGIILDADITELFASNFKHNVLSPKVIDSAAEIYYQCVLEAGCACNWIGERLSYSRVNGKEYIEQIINLAKKKQKNRNISLLQKAFSILNEDNHKVIRILGFKIKLKNHRN